MKFSAWVIFIAIWSIVVYAPMAHWVWGGGFLGGAVSDDQIIPSLQAMDFAGGLVVHINAGVAALALVLVLGPRLGWRRDVIRPHMLPLTVLGAGLLWFGWFGFNAGSAFFSDGTAGNAFLTTADRGCGRGADVGAVGAGGARPPDDARVRLGRGCRAGGDHAGGRFVSPLWALVIGAAAGVICFSALQLKFRFNFDDSLDVVAVTWWAASSGRCCSGCSRKR